MRDWMQIRKKGEMHYVLFYGVLGWGLLTAVLFQLIQHFAFEKSITIESVLITTTIFVIGGYFWGKFMWKFYERAIVDKDE